MSNSREGFLFYASGAREVVNVSCVPTKRLAYIDTTRGILIVLMLAVHAATPCNDSIREHIQGYWILDIATKGFVMLAGYTFGAVYTDTHPPQLVKTFRRCFELLVIMFCSNILFTLGRLTLSNEIDGTISWSWLIGLFTFQTEYNISGVLFPIALLLPVLFCIYHMQRRWGMAFTVGLTFMSSMMIYTWRGLESNSLIIAGLIEVGFVRGAGGFPLIPFIGYGLLGFFTAQTLRTAAGLQVNWLTFSTVMFIGLFLYETTTSNIAFRSSSDTNPVLMITKYMKAEGMFLIILGLGMAASLLSPQMTHQSPINLLGFYGLFAFVLHRLIGHSSILIFHLHEGGYIVFMFQFTIILVLTYGACLLRARLTSLDHYLSKMFL